MPATSKNNIAALIFEHFWHSNAFLECVRKVGAAESFTNLQSWGSEQDCHCGEWKALPICEYGWKASQICKDGAVESFTDLQ